VRATLIGTSDLAFEFHQYLSARGKGRDKQA
jgi:hypothetical protein